MTRRGTNLLAPLAPTAPRDPDRFPIRRRALVSFVALVLVIVGSATPVAGAAQPRAQTDPSGPATLKVSAQDLEVETDGDFRVFLDIADAPPGSDLAVRIYDRIRDDEGLAASTTARPADLLDTFDPIPLPPTDAPSQVGYFAIYLYGPSDPRPQGVPANFTYRLDEAGVYPVQVRLRAPDGETLASIVTYLVRRPDETRDVTPIDVALVTSVRQAPTGPRPLADAVDPDFLAALDRALQVFAGRPRLPVTFSITPDTAQRLVSDPAAAATLAALRTEIGRDRRQLTGGPYVPIDPAALVSNGLTDEVIRQADLGRRTLARTFPLPPERSAASTWVAGHPLGPATAELLANLGVAHVVLPAAAVASGTPAARFTVPGSGGRLDAITEGPDDLAGGTVTDPVLAGYQLLGRLAATASINPDGATTALRIDPQAVNTTELTTVLGVLAAPSTYLRPTTLAAAFADGAPTTRPPRLTQPRTARLGAYPALVTGTHRLLSGYVSMLVDPAGPVRRFEISLARSADDDLALANRQAELSRRSAELRRRLGAISVPARDRVTLGARNARFPLPITSTLDEPVRVVITLAAPDRLTFPDRTIEATLTQTRTVVPIRVGTRATGDTPLRITVRSPDGTQVLAESQYTVRSTAVSGVGLLLTIGAAGFLALWWGRHWRRGRRPQHRHGSSRRSDTPGSTLEEWDDVFLPEAGETADVTPTPGPGSKPG